MAIVDKLNLGCGQNVIPGWVNIDKVSFPGVTVIDVDRSGIPFPDNSFDELRCWGCLSEFQTDIVTMMDRFWRVLSGGGRLDITVAVVDNGIGAFRDPLARRYLSSQWIEYFYIGGQWENSGRGFGFAGKFKMVHSEVRGEVHQVILEAIK
jgi:predicted SAM-dependent methyltransferase